MTSRSETTDPTGGITDQSVEDQNSSASKNSALMLLSRIAVALVGWAGSVLVARTLSPEDWGQFSFVFAVLGLMSVFTDLGVGRAVLGRLIHGTSESIPTTATSFIALRALLGVLGYSIALSYVVATGKSSDVILATAIAGIVVLISSPSYSLTVLYQSRLRMGWVALGDSCSQLVQLAAIIALVLWSPWWVLFVIPPIVNEAFNFVHRARGLAHKNFRFTLATKIDTSLWKPILRESIPLTVGYAVVLLLTKVDLLLIEHLKPIEAVGQYAVAYKFADVVTIGLVAAVHPVATLLISHWPDKPKEFTNVSRKSVYLLSIVGFTGGTLFVPVAGDVITTMYGEAFSGIELTAQILFASATIAVLTNLALNILIAVEKPGLFPWIALSGLALNVGLNLLAIPRFGIEGAAGATLATEIVMVLCLWSTAIFSTKLWRLFPIAGYAGLVALAIGLVVAGHVVHTTTNLHWIGQTLVAAPIVLTIFGFYPLGQGATLLSMVKQVRS